MALTKDTIREWLQRCPINTGHMFVVLDKYEWEEYPVYIPRDADVSEKVKELDGPNMQKIMEIYDISEDWEYQINVTRAGEEWLNHGN